MAAFRASRTIPGLGGVGVAGVLCVTGILMGYVGNIVYRVGDNSRAQLFCNAVLVFSLPRTICTALSIYISLH